MGLKDIHYSQAYEFIRTCIPTEKDIAVCKIFEDYDLRIKPRYMSTFGTMCDYGVRSRQQNKCFGYIEIGMASGYIRDDLSHLLHEVYLSAEEAYWLATSKKPAKLGNDFLCDYAVVTDRAVAMYNSLRMQKAQFGAFYTAPEPVHYFECDCADRQTIVDMKVTRDCSHNKDYWVQLLLYSMMSKMYDGFSRRNLILLYPVQGIIKSYTYSSNEYSALYKAFLERKWT